MSPSLRRVLTSSEAQSEAPWERCEVVGDGDIFFQRLEGALEAAVTSIDLEFYIFAVDQTGHKFFEILA